MTDLIKQAKFEPNQPITLVETHIVNIDGQSVDIPVSVVFQLYPSPRVVIESDTLSDMTRGEHRKRIELRNDARLDVLLGTLKWAPKTGPRANELGPKNWTTS